MRKVLRTMPIPKATAGTVARRSACSRLANVS
jgi:hypothetical protein